MRASLRRFAPLAVAAAIALAAVPAIAAADFALAGWPYAKEVRTPPGTQEDLVELHPDAQLYDGSAPGLTDLRIIAAESRETPYKLDVRRGSSRAAGRRPSPSATWDTCRTGTTRSPLLLPWKTARSTTR